jgi:hypothetical protein
VFYGLFKAWILIILAAGKAGNSNFETNTKSFQERTCNVYFPSNTTVYKNNILIITQTTDQFHSPIRLHGVMLN